MAGECKLGDYCRFAHGDGELRTPVNKPSPEPNQMLQMQNYFAPNGYNNNNGNGFNRGDKFGGGYDKYNGGYDKFDRGVKGGYDKYGGGNRLGYGGNRGGDRYRDGQQNGGFNGRRDRDNGMGQHQMGGYQQIQGNIPGGVIYQTNQVNAGPGQQQVQYYTMAPQAQAIQTSE